jgi:hypothetical protein
MIKAFITGFTCFGVTFPMVVNQQYLLALIILVTGITMFALTLVMLLLKEENRTLKQSALKHMPTPSLDFLVTEKYKKSLSAMEINTLSGLLQADTATYRYN